MTAPGLSDTACLFCLFIAACSNRGASPGPNALHFTSLPSSQTGVGFENRITESDSVNLFIHEYTYMGSGVGVGDFNNDGLPDLFFASAQGSSTLYLNKGHMQF